METCLISDRVYPIQDKRGDPKGSDRGYPRLQNKNPQSKAQRAGVPENRHCGYSDKTTYKKARGASPIILFYESCDRA
jgi:hypothetical protein